MTGPLTGIKVIDLCQVVAGPWATMLLGSLGAEVIKVEPPAPGDLAHTTPPKQRSLSVVYAHSNLNKRSIILDLKNAEDRETCYRLIEDADLFVENMRPGVADRLGLAYEKLSALNPRIVYLSASAWGRQGPLASMGGIDVSVQAFSGWAMLTGTPGGAGEIFRFGAHLDVSTASFLVAAALQALLLRQRTGRGQRVDVTMLGAAMNLQLTRLAEFFATRENPLRRGSASATTVPHQAFLCQDRQWLAVGVVNDEQWQGLCRATELDHLSADSRFCTNPARVEHREELIPLLEKKFLSKPSLWWTARLAKEAVPHGPFLDPLGLRYHAQALENRYLVEMDVPGRGRMLFGGLPWRFEKTPAELKPCPYPGAHTAEVRESLARSRVAASAVPGRSGPGHPLSTSHRGGEGWGEVTAVRAALAGMRVVDVTQGLCGPFASLLLADAGAEVIKVEPLGGDCGRQFGPPFLGGRSPAFLALNRNKKSLGLDIKHPAAAEALQRLIHRADVLLEDLGPGKAEAAGFGYGQVQTGNPRLVYASITAFGEQGPLRDLPGAELVVQALAEYWASVGAMGEPPERLGADVAGMNTAVFAIDAILAALLHRADTGEGQYVSVSMLGTLLHMRGILWSSRHDPDDWAGPHQEGNYLPRDHGYRTKDRQVYFSLRRGGEEDYVRFLSELNMTHVLEDPRFGDGGREAVGRGLHAAEVKPHWEEAFRDRSAEEIIALVRRYGGDAVAFNDYPALLAHPQVGSLGILREKERFEKDHWTSLEPPWQFSDAELPAVTPAPAIGQDTVEVLKGLDYAGAEIVKLEREGVIRTGRAG